MPTITFLWHLHQPAYRTADGVARAPWVAVHAGGAYTTLARSILEAGGRGQVVNLVPSLVEQLEAYRDGTVSDPVLDSLTTPPKELSASGLTTLLEWAFHVTPRQLERYPRLGELARRPAARASGAGSRPGRADLRDLQVLFVLAQAGEQAWRDPELAPLAERGAGFTAADQRTAAAWLTAQPARVLGLWRELARKDGVEIATSPYAHPIMPLLADTGVVRESWAPAPPPEVPRFSRPDDARRQLDEALAFMAARGFPITGCWPPEGSVSDAALEIYGAAGIRWLVTDEGILERTLERDLRAGGRAPVELARPWRRSAGSPSLFFRDRQLSDRIGFVYGRWGDERQAAADLVRQMETAAAALPQDGALVLALDGENPWLHYPEGGGVFLRALIEGVAASQLEPATLAELAGRLEPAGLSRLHPGSWIGGTFSTWIGHPEKSRAWSLLAAVRKLVGDGDPPPSMMLAEGSDWFWWLGDDNPTPLAPLYDEIFRRHLTDACEQAGVTPPGELARPLKATPAPAAGAGGLFRSQEGPAMSELRFDPIKQRWAIIASERKLRPHEFVLPQLGASTDLLADCPFEAGHEQLTPPEILSIAPPVPRADGSPWQVRVVPNKFPALRVEGTVDREGIGIFDRVSGVGAHEVIVESPDHHREMADLEAAELALVFRAYRERLIDLRRDTRLRYALIFKNAGREAGASLSHPHSQLIATPIIPTFVITELNAGRQHFRRKERCIFCDLIHQEELLGDRIAIAGDRFIALQPFAAALPFETWILPRRHCHDLAAVADDELLALAAIVRDLLRRMRSLLGDPPYNMVVHTAPSPHPRPGQPDYWSTIEHDFHWHLEIVPRITRLAGFEWGSGYTINPTPPEEAARFLREADPDGGAHEEAG